MMSSTQTISKLTVLLQILRLYLIWHRTGDKFVKPSTNSFYSARAVHYSRATM